jgi:hypothetical protein
MRTALSLGLLALVVVLAWFRLAPTRTAVQDVPAAVAVQEGSGASVAGTWQGTLTLPAGRLMRWMLAHDPLPPLRALEIPALALFGEWIVERAAAAR